MSGVVALWLAGSGGVGTWLGTGSPDPLTREVSACQSEPPSKRISPCWEGKPGGRMTFQGRRDAQGRQLASKVGVLLIWPQSDQPGVRSSGGRMAEYHFVSTWQIQAPIERVWERFTTPSAGRVGGST